MQNLLLILITMREKQCTLEEAITIVKEASIRPTTKT